MSEQEVVLRLLIAFILIFGAGSMFFYHLLQEVKNTETEQPSTKDRLSPAHIFNGVSSKKKKPTKSTSLIPSVQCFRLKRYKRSSNESSA